MLQTSSSEDGSEGEGNVRSSPIVSKPTASHISQPHVTVLRSWATGLPLEVHPRSHRHRPVESKHTRKPSDNSHKKNTSETSNKQNQFLPNSSSSSDEEESYCDSYDEEHSDKSGPRPFVAHPLVARDSNDSLNNSRNRRPLQLVDSNEKPTVSSSLSQLTQNTMSTSQSGTAIEIKNTSEQLASSFPDRNGNKLLGGSYENIFMKTSSTSGLTKSSPVVARSRFGAQGDTASLKNSTTSVSHPNDDLSSRKGSSATNFNEDIRDSTVNPCARNTQCGTSSSHLQMLLPLEESNRKQRLLLYVLISRCIAYTFHSKYPSEQKKFHLKIDKTRIQELRKNFQSFLDGETDIVADDAFRNAIQNYLDFFLRSERLAARVVCGCLSMVDLREVFRFTIEKRIERLLPIEGLNKETVMISWMGKFDHICRWQSANLVLSKQTSGTTDVLQQPAPLSQQQLQSLSADDNRIALANYSKMLTPQTEMIVGREKLYDLFQQILGVKKYEHQILFNACQFDNADEQAAQVRRELDIRKQKLEERKRNRTHPKLVVNEMETMYFQEEEQNLSKLYRELEAVPVSQAGWTVGLQKLKMRPGRGFRSSNLGHGNSGTHGSNLSLTSESPLDVGGSANGTDSPTSNKLNLKLTFNIEIEIRQLRRIPNLPARKIIFCTMQVVGCEKKMTNQAEVSNPVLQTVGEFCTNQPLPLVKVKLMLENNSILSLDHKEIAKLELHPKCTSSHAMRWYRMLTPNEYGGALSRFSMTGNSPHSASQNDPNDDIQIQLSIVMSKPPNLKQCGYVFVEAKTVYRQWKQRYLCLVQVSQFTFVLASFKERRSEPSKWLRIEGFTVDYCDPKTDLLQEKSKYFFTLVKEGDQVLLACEQESERHLWVQALYRATGQSHKPTPPVNMVLSRAQQQHGENNRAQQLGLQEYVITDPSGLPHLELFRLLLALTLQHRLHCESYVSMGWLSPVEQFVLDEYAARYGIRESQRTLFYLSELIRQASLGNFIDPTLLLITYSQSSLALSGKGSDGNGVVVNSILAEDVHQMMELKETLLGLLEKQIVEFRYCFPFGRPTGALKLTLALLERVLMTESSSSPTNPSSSSEELREFLHRCLEHAAMFNYTRITENVDIENPLEEPTKKFEELLRLADLCIEVVQENEDYHSEPFLWFSDLMVQHSEKFWSLFSVDLNLVLTQLPKDYWEMFTLFQLLNDYLLTNSSLCRGTFHKLLINYFAPNVVRYLDLHEMNMMRELCQRLEKETFQPQPLSKEEMHESVSPVHKIQTTSSSFHSSIGSAEEARNARLLHRQASLSCSTVNDVLWKLEHLQSFVEELHWPDEEFAQHLRLRVSTMGSDLIHTICIKLEGSFVIWLKRGDLTQKTVEYLIPLECCVMINSGTHLRDFALQQLRMNLNLNEGHQYHASCEESVNNLLHYFIEQMTEKLIQSLKGCLKTLSRYDEHTFVSSLLSLTKPVDESGKQYVEFVCSNAERLRQKIRDDEFLMKILKVWYDEQVQCINNWLHERENLCLHSYQLNCIQIIINKLYSEFSFCLFQKEDLRDSTYEDILHRLRIEEATLSVKQPNEKFFKKTTSFSQNTLSTKAMDISSSSHLSETERIQNSLKRDSMESVNCPKQLISTGEHPRRSVLNVVGGSLRTLASPFSRRPS